jgi:serine/threonine protein kinase
MEQLVDGIIHHDLKHGNVLMTKDNQVKICDFDVSRFISHDSYANTMVKTHNYQLPKVVQEQNYSYSVDVWRFGCILYELMKRKKSLQTFI